MDSKRNNAILSGSQKENRERAEGILIKAVVASFNKEMYL